MREMVGGCCVCSDDRGWSENPLVYCDGQSCTVAVHQACYGIVTVPTGPWYCRKCESQERSVKVKCELCPSKYGALKRTDNSGWAHVVCALYIPEVRFGNVTTMEPIQLQLIPAERFNKVCYICEEKGKASNATVGACMQCNKAGCKQQFHVTCAQSLGLLCEEAGNYLDNVKYCGYCQYHYSKLKKGGNVKTIPPYKPVSSENHLSDSNSEKEVEGGQAKTSSTQLPTPIGTTASGSTGSSGSSSSKRKSSSSSSKPSSSSSTSSSSKTSSGTKSSFTHQKTVHNSSGSTISTASSNKSADKVKVSNNSSTTNIKSVKSADSDVNHPLGGEVAQTSLEPPPKVEARDFKTEISEQSIKSASLTTTELGKDSKSSKKRKTHSRTPTPVTVISSECTAATSAVTETAPILATIDNKKATSEGLVEKFKKAKVETTQSILINQPVVALTSISTIKSISQTSIGSTVSDTAGDNPTLPPPQGIIQSSVNSLVVSVPLANTTLSPHPAIVNNQASVVIATIESRSVIAPERHSNSSILMAGGSSNQGNSIISSEMSGGGLKITYEKQDAVTTEVDMELEMAPQESTFMKNKSEKGGRGKKRGSGNSNSANGIITQLNNTSISKNKNPNRGSQAAAATSSHQPGAFSSISQAQLKDSPPSSPSSESQGGSISQSSTSRGRPRARKSAPAAMPTSNSPKDTKDIKLFQNGVNAPHMLGNQLNPASNMAQKMSDHLNSELEAHSIFNPNESSVNMVGPQLHHRVIASTRASSTGGSSTASGGSGLSSMLGGNGGNIPQTLDQLLERQWEQGSQFLMEQAQHFDIASLLSCLHQLRAENLRLEDHVSSLLQRRDHLLAVNARLAIPLTGQPATSQASHPHTVNNIHPVVAATHADVSRSSRHSGGGSNYHPPHPQAGLHPGGGGGQVIENGLPGMDPAQNYGQQHSHRSAGVPSQSQPSPSIRHSSPAAAAGYPNSTLLRQNADTSGRSAPRPQPYPVYQGPGPSSQQPQQMVIRRDSDIHHQASSKPS